ncbi:hypothetical protein BGX23_001173 [Mortierella sp. AD031]|nr:hypothetical protein BGX23_001173 [Mortierella sp. AD031]
MATIPPLTSTIVATVFTTLVAALSCVQLYRSRTPLRLGAAVMAVCGLSISALSIVYAAEKMSLSIFWVYQFVAECIAVTWVISTIIQLGYAFYPLTRHQTLIWRTALASVIVYDLVAISELSYYCFAVWGSHSLTKESTPVIWIYWVRQLVKVTACAVTIAYLFVPLVRHHHSTGVAMIADSNTLAVGTWYLSALGVTSLGYCAMFIYYMTKPDKVFSPQAQALDLCIRLITCPIFSLPPPRILLRHYQDKYGSGARDDHNTMIEDGITNDPRPRRPAMLIAQTSFPSARNNSSNNNDFLFEHPSSFHKRPSLDFGHSTYAIREMEEDRSKRFLEDDANVGTTSSSDSTAAETNSPGGGDDPTATATAPSSVSSSLRPTTSNSEHKTYPVVGMDEAVLSNLSILTRSIEFQTPPTTFATGYSSTLPASLANNNNNTGKRDKNEETAEAARRISRRLTMEGRRDGLDILNIAGRLKWPHRSNNITSGQPGTNNNNHRAPTEMATISPPTSPVAIKSSQSFPPMALHRAGAAGRSADAGIDLHHVTSSKKERLSAIGSVSEADEYLKDHHQDHPSYCPHALESTQERSEKAFQAGTTTSTTATNYINMVRSASPPPSRDTTPTDLAAKDKIRRQSRDILTRLHKGGHQATTSGASAITTSSSITSTTTGPHSPMSRRTSATTMAMTTPKRYVVEPPPQQQQEVSLGELRPSTSSESTAGS